MKIVPSVFHKGIELLNVGPEELENAAYRLNKEREGRYIIGRHLKYYRTTEGLTVAPGS